jgi:hypothetical protein
MAWATFRITTMRITFRLKNYLTPYPGNDYIKQYRNRIRRAFPAAEGEFFGVNLLQNRHSLTGASFQLVTKNDVSFQLTYTS